MFGLFAVVVVVVGIFGFVGRSVSLVGLSTVEVFGIEVDRVFVEKVALVGIECVVGADMSLACSPEKSKKSKRTRRRKAKRRKLLCFVWATHARTRQRFQDDGAGWARLAEASTSSSCAQILWSATLSTRSSTPAVMHDDALHTFLAHLTVAPLHKPKLFLKMSLQSLSIYTNTQRYELDNQEKYIQNTNVEQGSLRTANPIKYLLQRSVTTRLHNYQHSKTTNCKYHYIYTPKQQSSKV